VTAYTPDHRDLRITDEPDDSRPIRVLFADIGRGPSAAQAINLTEDEARELVGALVARMNGGPEFVVVHSRGNRLASSLRSAVAWADMYADGYTDDERALAFPFGPPRGGDLPAVYVRHATEWLPTDVRALRDAAEGRS
jgi:hypothetical protein